MVAAKKTTGNKLLAFSFFSPPDDSLLENEPLVPEEALKDFKDSFT